LCTTVSGVADARTSIAAAALSQLARNGKFDAKKAQKAIAELGVNAEKKDPARA